jgi:DNA-binding transcriptional LysR family regulator
MELRHLRYFIAVAEEGHFTRAAERLHIQQPPLSQQIRALEEELGFALFHRHSRGAALTLAGEAFLAEARAVLGGLGAGIGRAQLVARGLRGRLTVGATSSASAHPLIPCVLRAARAAWPEVQMEFTEGNAAELTQALAQQKLDVAFIRKPVDQPPRVEFHRLADEEMLLVLPHGHQAAYRSHAGRMECRLADLAHDGFILVRRTGAPGMYADLLAACGGHGFAPRIVLEVDRMLTNIGLVASGIGVSAVPASMRGFHEQSVHYCHIADLRQPLSAPLTMVLHADRRSAVVDNFVRQTLDLAQAATPLQA